MSDTNYVELTGVRMHDYAEWDTEEDNRILKCSFAYDVQKRDGTIKQKITELVFREFLIQKAKEIPVDERVRVKGRLRVRRTKNFYDQWKFIVYILVDEIEAFHYGNIINTVKIKGKVRSKVTEKDFTTGKRMSCMVTIPEITEHGAETNTFIYMKFFESIGKGLKQGDEVEVKGSLLAQSIYGKSRTFVKATEINGTRLDGKTNRALPTANAKSLRIFAIDPGNALSGYALFDMPDMHLIEFGKVTNEELEKRLNCIPDYDVAVIEMVSNYGTNVGKTIFDTVLHIGRFIKIWENHGFKPELVYRHEEKMNLVGRPVAKDKDIKAALVARFAKYDFKTGKGTQKNPDTFFGVAQDVWQAIAVGVTYYDELKQHKR